MPSVKWLDFFKTYAQRLLWNLLFLSNVVSTSKRKVPFPHLQEPNATFPLSSVDPSTVLQLDFKKIRSILDQLIIYRKQNTYVLFKANQWCHQNDSAGKNACIKPSDPTSILNPSVEVRNQFLIASDLLTSAVWKHTHTSTFPLSHTFVT